MSHAQKIREADGGFSSRKLWLGVGTSFAICLMGFAAGYWPSLDVNLSTIIGGLVAVYTIYNGANVGAKMTLGNTMAKLPILTPTPDAPADPPEPKEPRPTHK